MRNISFKSLRKRVEYMKRNDRYEIPFPFDIDFKRNIEGLYIALEGIDGSGKTTQVERLVEELKNREKKYIQTREPRKGVGSDWKVDSGYSARRDANSFCCISISFQC